MSESFRPLPSPTTLTAPFWKAAKEKRLVVQKCEQCSQLQFYPREICTHCMHDVFEWESCSGKGQIYTFTVNHRAANAYMKDHLPYIVAVIDLAEGVRLMSNIVDSAPDDVHIGAPVEVVFEEVNEEITLVQFKIIT